MAIVTLNEEKNIKRAISSCVWAAEVIIYDSGSTDLTVDIAQKMGAKVIKGEWLGFGPSKRYLSEKTANDWIFSLDADEEVSEQLAAEIKALYQDLDQSAAYRTPRISFYLRRWIKFGGWYPDYQVRLFNKKTAMWNNEIVHEKIEAKKYLNLASNLNHYVFKNIEHQIQTNNRYSSLLAEKMFQQGKSFSYFHFLTKPIVKFFECYIYKMGFLDGYAGFVIAVNAAHSVFMKWSKLKELAMRTK